MPENNDVFCSIAFEPEAVRQERAVRTIQDHIALRAVEAFEKIKAKRKEAGMPSDPHTWEVSVRSIET